MNNRAQHLTEKAASLLALSDDDRIRELFKYRWIGYPIAKTTLGKLETLFNRPKVHRMRNLLIVGDSNNGKSEILKRCLKMHPGDDNPSGEKVSLPILLIQAPPTPDEGRLYDEILNKLGAPFNRRDTAGKKLHQVATLFEHIGTKMLMLVT